MFRYGHKEFLIYEHQENVNAIWHDGFTFWLAPDREHDAVGCEALSQLRAIVDNMYDNPSYVALASECRG